MIRPHGVERCTSSVVSGYALHVVAGARVGTIENSRELAFLLRHPLEVWRFERRATALTARAKPWH
jgi:hypothetical protein